MKQKVKITAVGCGYWGTNLVRNIAANPNAELEAICDPDPAALERVGSRYPGVERMSRLEDVFARGSSDAVVLATPSGQHAAQALAALDNNMHVLVEKPMATTVAEAVELAEAVEQSGRLLMVGHTFLYNNVVREVKQRLGAGDLGSLRYAYSQRLNLGRFRRDSDVMWTLAPHDLSIFNYWFDSRPHRVSAHGRSHVLVEERVADVSFCLLEYPDGRSAHLHLSWLDPQKVRRMVLVGDDKMLVYDDMDQSRHIQLFDKGVERDHQNPLEDYADFHTRLRTGDLVVPNIRLSEPLAVEIAHFVDCVQSASRPLTDHRHGLDVTCALAALEESMRDAGRPVTVEYPR